jgi:hypothetical protein
MILTPCSLLIFGSKPMIFLISELLLIISETSLFIEVAAPKIILV